MTACDIDFDLVFREDEFRHRFLSGEDENSAFYAMELSAKTVLSLNSWCPPTVETYVAAYCPPIVAVFLYKFDKQHPLTFEDKDGFPEWIWVVVGDLPPICSLYEPLKDGLDALRYWVAAYQTWLERFDAGLSLEELTFLDVPEDAEHAEMLRGRVEFLLKHFLYNERPPLFPGLPFHLK